MAVAAMASSDCSCESDLLSRQVAHLGKYAAADDKEALKQLMMTSAVAFVPYVIVWCMTECHPLMCGMLAVFAGLVKVRIFMVFHDASHGCFFSPRLLKSVVGWNGANRLLSEALAVLVWTSNSYWKYTHDRHHHVLCRTDEMDEQNYTWTLRYHKDQSRIRKQLYAFVRSGYAKLSYVPFLYFVIKMRVRSSWLELCLFCLYLVSFALMGLWRFEVVSICVGMWYGFVIFQTQHIFQGEDLNGNVKTAERFSEDAWTRGAAATEGASITVVPRVLKWFHMGNEYHSLHHLNAMVPGYRLQQCYEDGGCLFSSHPHIFLFPAVWFALRHCVYDEETMSFTLLPSLDIRLSDIPEITKAYAKMWKRSNARSNRALKVKYQ